MTQLDAADDLLGFIDRAPSPYHAVRAVAARLDAAGYQRRDERDPLTLEANEKFYVVRAGTTLAAFHVGTDAPSQAGFSLIGAHTDSPNLRVKPTPDSTTAGCRQLAVEPYGGVLYHTWLDRDLSLAGRVAVLTDEGVGLHEVDFARPLLRIPSLAIHLHRGVNTDGLTLNAQRHLPPVWALESTETSLQEALAEVLEPRGAYSPEQIISWDLGCYDVTPSTRSGLRGEFLHAPRLDNLASCHAATQALVDGANERRPHTRGVILFDHEEVGSRSAQGAASSFLATWLERIAAARGDGSRESTARALARSFLVSSDMAHAAHPNYLDRHEPAHRPELGAGLVIKSNSSQSYTTSADTAARFTAYCREVGAPVQQFVTRSDLGCGSTIGPITAAQLGIAAIDVGNPMLSMHSAREMAAAADVAPMIRALGRCLLR